MAQASPHVDKVLIVDDAPDIVDLVTAALRDEGYRLFSASDGESGLQMVKAEQPNLILLDWLMPGMTGIDFCQALRQDPDPKIRGSVVVMLTAQRLIGQMKAGYEAKANDYLLKPFEPAELRDRVRKWLAWARERAGA